VVILGSLTAFAPLSIDMYLASMPTLEKFYSTSSDMIQLTLASFFLGFSLGQLFYGPLSDRYGRKLPLYIGLLLFVLSSVGCALSVSIEWMIFFRFIQALGACSGGVIVRAIIRDMFHPDDASRIFSYMMLVTGLAPMLAPIFGGYVLLTFGWKAIFITLATMGLMALFAVYWLLDESHEETGKSLNIKDVLFEYFRLLKHKQLMGYAFMSGFVMSGMFAYITISSFVFIDHFKLSVNEYGLLFGTCAAVFVIAAQINARIIGIIKHKTITTIAIITIVVLSSIMFSGSILTSSIYTILLPLLGYMFCVGFIVPNSIAHAMAPFSYNAGSASALLGTLQFSMAAISSITVGHLKTTPAVSMSVIIFVCSVSSCIIYFSLLRHSK
jgi:DHA1 family bicyclomycin/chloramphenicol resistance-like MFS transporter